jgi:hypothetical protein
MTPNDTTRATSQGSLKACPFCGGHPIREFDLNAQGGKQWWTTECDNCGCLMTETGIHSESDADFAWNRRHRYTGALSLALKFHETYERLAPSFGYATRTETRVFDPESSNGKLMISVCAELAAAPTAPAIPARVDDNVRKVIRRYDDVFASEPNATMAAITKNDYRTLRAAIEAAIQANAEKEG